MTSKGASDSLRKSKPLEACWSWVAIESVMVAGFISFTVIVQLVLAETKDFLTDSDLQGRVESGNDSPPRISLILDRALSVTTS